MGRDTNILHFDRFNVERSVYPPGLHMAPHTDKLSRISIILDGELRESTKQGSINATRNCVVIKPNHVVHENTFGASPLRLLSISFNDPSLLAQYFDEWQWINHPAMGVLGVRLWTQMQWVKNDGDLMKLFSAFFATLSSLAQEQDTHRTAWPDQLKELLETNLDEPQAIQALSEQLSLHRVSMARGFKRRYSLSPVQFRKYTRVMTALQELALTQKSLAAIAYDAGFADQSHLTRALKSLAGCTPGEFRRLMKGNEA
jgi:AraC family transcriptional regulator